MGGRVVGAGDTFTISTTPPPRHALHCPALPRWRRIGTTTVTTVHAGLGHTAWPGLAVSDSHNGRGGREVTLFRLLGRGVFELLRAGRLPWKGTAARSPEPASRRLFIRHVTTAKAIAHH